MYLAPDMLLLSEAVVAMSHYIKGLERYKTITWVEALIYLDELKNIQVNSPVSRAWRSFPRDQYQSLMKAFHYYCELQGIRFVGQ